jgi:cell division protease FtsH
MFFLAIPLLFLAGYSEGFRSLPFRFLSTSRETKRIQKTILFITYPSDYPKNETLEIEIAKQRMKEKMQKKHFPYSKRYFENSLKRVNRLLTNPNRFEDPSENLNSPTLIPKPDLNTTSQEFLELFQNISYRIYNNSGYFDYEITLEIEGDEDEYQDGEDSDPDYDIPEIFVVSNKQSYPKKAKEPHTRNKGILLKDRSSNSNKDKKKKSENFEVLDSSPISFKDIGGYENIKQELMQCIDILRNYTKYQDYNVRTPKGLILEGPPGNGKTLLAKGFAGEANASFIAVSGSEFQEKYVGVGAARVRELFELAADNIPCVIFIDEMDAIGRKRSNDAEASNSERDATLNQLLVNMDGFASSSGIFIVGATNRADLLDPALVRPGRIDKRIFIGLPDAVTREAILAIHIRGKPHDATINVTNLVEITQGFSGSQLENLLNEAMLLAIRNAKTEFAMSDVENVMDRFLAGWQPTEHKFTGTMLEKIAIHEMGHAIVGLLAKHHSKMTKVVINLSSPQSPGYTVFESSSGGLYTREALFEHLMILLAGRIAEEVFYNVSVTTGAINDFEEALKLAEKMVVYYGMGRNLIYPSLSEKYKERIDSEVVHLIQDAYSIAYFIVSNSKYIIQECADILQKEKILRAETMLEIAKEKYPRVLELHS